MPEQQAEKSIFLAAVEIESEAERAAFVEHACAGNPQLRAELDALLEAHAKPQRLLDAAPTPGPTTDQPLAEIPGTVIGPYKLLEQIGEGGMGVVWMAQQTEPVKRVVALKLIKAGMDSKQIIARFEAERQALALMEHPNIARVLDAGATSAGRPYFVMDLVKGVPITRYCDEHHLTPRQRLELFLPVCQAIQHAHQKGIIHRDLKPSNVLVALYDGKPVPKVIDFGVAKAAGQPLTEQTLVTGFGAIVGTLEYMSPEQAEINQLDIDTRSDIYSLGVLLYELLTGSPPFTKKDLEKAGMLEMLRVIREQEPSKPSTKLSTAEGLPTLAANRGTEPAKLTKLVRGELDWIVMKALEKDRNRRYETANGFAMDVQRYLADEAVLACPPSAGYRLRKFARRNKAGLAVAALALFFLVLLGSGVGWAVRDRSAREAEEARRQEERQAKVAGQVEPLLAEVARLTKELKWDEALPVARRAGAAVAGGEADEETRERVRQVLRDLEMVARLEELRLEEYVGVRTHLHAAAFRDFGVDVETLPAEEAAARLRARPAVAVALAEGLDDWAIRVSRRDPDQFERLRALAADVDPDPWRVSVRRAAARDVDALVKLANDPDTARQPPHSQHVLAASLGGRGQLEQAITLLERACEIHPGDFWIHYELAVLNRKVRPARLEAAVRHSIAARALRPRSIAAWVSLGNALHTQKKLDEAITAYRKAIELDPKNAVAHNNLGLPLREQNRLDEAIAWYKKAIELDPKYAHAHMNLGDALYGQKKWDQASAAYKKAVELDPKDARNHAGLGNCLRMQKKLPEAVDALRKAVELDPKDARAHGILGTALRAQGKLPEAIDALRKAVELDPKYSDAHFRLGLALSDHRKLDDAVAAYKKVIDLDPKYVNAHVNLGALLCDDLKQYDKAIECFRTALELDPKSAKTHTNLGLALRRKGNLDQAVAAFEKAIELDPKHANAYHSLGALLCDDRKEYDKAIECFRTALELDPKSAKTYTNLGEALHWKGNLDQAVAAFQKAIELDPKHANAHNSLGALLCDDRQEYDKAIECFRKALEIHPQFAWARSNLGVAMGRKGWDLVKSADPKHRDASRALEVVQEAAKVAPQSAQAWQMLGWVQYRVGDWRASIEALEKSCRLEKGGDSRQWIVLALAHARLAGQESLPAKEREEHRSQARRWYDQAVKQIDARPRRPGDVTGQGVWDFRAEARELMKKESGVRHQESEKKSN